MASPVGMVDRSYLLQEQLGEGGMGTVYRVLQLVNGQQAALKLVPDRLRVLSSGTQSPDVLARLALAREFQMLAWLHHPNVIRVISYGFDDELGPYFIMDLLNDALTLTEAAANCSEEGRIKLIAQLLRALAYIHQRGVIHRDIKPGNVLVVHDEVKLLDFGISVEKAEAMDFAGTMEYMAPEIMRGEPASAASDLYAVGVLFYQMLRGRLPSAMVGSMNQMLDSLLEEESGLAADGAGFQGSEAPLADLTPPMFFPDFDTRPPATTEIPGPLGEVVSKLLAPQLEERYKDATSVLRDLAAAVSFELPVETSATRESFLRATVLIGREAEMATLTRALELAKLGTGSAFLIGGESGVGKSRLIAELRTLALVHGYWVADGQGVAEGGYYYQEWLPLLRSLCFRCDMTEAEASVLKDLVPDISNLLGRPVADAPAVKAEEVQARLVSTLRDLLRRLTKPVVLILEDLHWARSESQALLVQLTKHAANLPLLIVGTFRADEVPQLAETLSGMQLMRLMRLNESSIARLSESMLGGAGRRPELVAYLARQTEGNAFFLVEIVRALAENAGDFSRINQGELPESVLTVGIERILERRIDMLPKSFLPWIEFAATLGRKLDLGVMARAFPAMPQRTFLIECANAALLESQGNDWLFAHNKLREAILHRIDPGHRRRLHRDVADAIETTYTDAQRDIMSATLAYHFEQAGVPDKALQYYIQAGDSATKLYLFEESRAHYAAAKATLEQLPDSPEVRRLHVDVLLKQVHTGLTTQLQLSRLTEARSLLEGLMNSAAAQPEDRLRMARIDYYCGQAYHFDGQPREAIVYYQRVLPIAQEFPDQQLRIMPSYVIGGALCIQGHFGKARELLTQATEPMFQYFGDSLDVRRCMMYRCIALGGSGHCQQALAGIERVRALTNPTDPPIHQVVYRLYHVVTATVMTDWPIVDKLATELVTFLEGTKEQLFLYLALDFLAWARSHLGRNAEAMKIRARAIAVRQTTISGGLSDWFEGAYAEILLSNGETEQALLQAQKVVASSQKAGLPFSQAIAERVWGCALGRLGHDIADAEAHFAASLNIARGAEQMMNEALAELWWGELCRERGDQISAQPHFAAALRLLETGGYEYALAGARQLVAGT